MRTDAELQARSILPRVVDVACAGCMLSGILVLVGWQFDIEVLKTLLHPLRTAMNPVSAVSFILASISLWTQRRESAAAVWRVVGLACAMAVITIAVLRL